MQYVKSKTVNIDQDEIIHLHAIEHDTKTRFINFKFVGDNRIIDLSNCNVRIYGKNSRYIEIFNDLKVLDAKKGIAQLELTDKMLRPGVTEYQLKIMPNGGGQLSSNTMKIVIDEDLMRDCSVESSNEYKAFENALKTIDEYDLRWQSGNIKTKDSILFENVVLKAMEQLIYNGNKIYDTAHKPTPADIGASPSDHNHDDRYLKKEVGATNESFRFRTKFLEFGVDNSRLGEIGVGPTDTYLHNTKSDKYLALKDDGRIVYDNKKVLIDIQSTPLWQGFHHMSGNESVTPSKKLSDCNNGWVLVWSDFDDGAGPQNWNVVYSYIPKNTIFKTGQNTTLPLTAGESTWAIKTLYIYDTYFRGNDTNKKDGNYDVVLRAVLEY